MNKHQAMTLGQVFKFVTHDNYTQLQNKKKAESASLTTQNSQSSTTYSHIAKVEESLKQAIHSIEKQTKVAEDSVLLYYQE